MKSSSVEIIEDFTSMEIVNPPVELLAAKEHHSYNVEIKKFISNINSYSSAFRVPGQTYDDVLNVMKKYLGEKANILYNMNSVVVPSTGQRNELNGNLKIVPAIYEADVVLTMNQINHMVQYGRSKRKMTSNSTLLWTKTKIPYRWATDDEMWRSKIKSTLLMFSQKTCLRFIENGEGTDYLLFNRGEGCYSSVGRLGGAQEISIGHGCDTIGIISHEIGHSLGFWHEQARPERDDYVRIYLNNAVSGTEGQFDKHSPLDSLNLGAPYDYGSVMHYSSNAFAKSSTVKTVVPTDPTYEYTIGGRIEPSFLDYKALNSAYCSNACLTGLSCQHGGYPDPNYCGRCSCPTGLGGIHCEKVQHSSCGSELLSTSNQWQNLSFSGSSSCYWKIKTDFGHRIHFEFTYVFFKCAPVCEEFVEVKHGVTHEETGSRLCCKAEFGERISEGDNIIVITRATVHSEFVLRYKSEPLSKPHGPPGIKMDTVTSAPTTIANTKHNVWSEWSVCSEMCGSCGNRYRIRSCITRKCSGEENQVQVCNLKACEPDATIRGRIKRDMEDNEIRNRSRRTGKWCCANYKLTSGNWCSPILNPNTHK